MQFMNDLGFSFQQKESHTYSSLCQTFKCLSDEKINLNFSTIDTFNQKILKVP